MARKSLEHLECAVANTVDIIRDSWTILILRDAFLGVRRFDEFVTDLGIARNVLSDRLGHLVRAGLLEALAYQNNPPRHEYRLTERGKDLFDVLMTLWSYGERWNPPPDRSHQRVMHLTCGHEAQAVAHCSHCGERLRRRDVRVEPPLPVVAARHTASSLS
ncbi:MAG TPA: helix-turn-helix domain-containing protein [Acidimicrobiia bacterium]|nr:helix-turn-helix domain-containing protein [Acidimicrobiia bacterium]